MMNRYYAELLDVTDDNDVVLYGYAFTAKGMHDAKMHAMNVCREMRIVPLPTVWRVSKVQYAWMSVRYSVPTKIERPEYEAA